MKNKKNILICVTGSVSAYKAFDVLRFFQKKDFPIKCALSPGGEKFINKLTLESLLQEKVSTDIFGDYPEKRAIHISLAEWAGVVIVVPASANFLARVAHGFADCLVSATVLATKAKVLFAPAMHSNMWLNPVTQKNVETLKEFGYGFVGPKEGMLSDGTSGIGHIAALNEIVNSIECL